MDSFMEPDVQVFWTCLMSILLLNKTIFKIKQFEQLTTWKYCWINTGSAVSAWNPSFFLIDHVYDSEYQIHETTLSAIISM